MMRGSSLLPSGIPHWSGRGLTTQLLRAFVNTEFGRMASHGHEAGGTAPFPSALSFHFFPCCLASKSPTHWPSLLRLDVPVYAWTSSANGRLIFSLHQTSWYQVDQWVQAYGEGDCLCLPGQMLLKFRVAWKGLSATDSVMVTETWKWLIAFFSW